MLLRACLLGWGQVRKPFPHLVPGSRAWFCWAACADSSPPQAMRTLSWKHTLGLVTMDVELADRTLSVAVTPVQAVVLLYFQDQGELTVQALLPQVWGWAGRGPPLAVPSPLGLAQPSWLPPQPAGPWRS